MLSLLLFILPFATASSATAAIVAVAVHEVTTAASECSSTMTSVAVERVMQCLYGLSPSLINCMLTLLLFIRAMPAQFFRVCRFLNKRFGVVPPEHIRSFYDDYHRCVAVNYYNYHYLIYLIKYYIMSCYQHFCQYVPEPATTLVLRRCCANYVFYSSDYNICYRLLSHSASASTATIPQKPFEQTRFVRGIVHVFFALVVDRTSCACVAQIKVAHAHLACHCNLCGIWRAQQVPTAVHQYLRG